MTPQFTEQQLLERADWYRRQHTERDTPDMLTQAAADRRRVEALERKYGSELAGSMIYAASRPDKLPPDFFASNGEAMADIKRCAEQHKEPQK
jgi:hypothetical protein